MENMSNTRIVESAEYQIKKVKEELRLRGASPRTIKSYVGILREYFFWKGGGYENLDEKNVRGFLLYKESKGSAASTRNLILNAVKYFYRDVVREEEEIGDLFFTLVNLCRHLGVDPRRALKRSNEKFASRFERIGQAIEEAGRTLTLEEMEAIWQGEKLKDG